MATCYARRALLLLLAVSWSAISAPTQLVNESPKTITEIEPGLFLVDFGKVAFGNLSLTGREGQRSRVTVRFGEALKSGRVDQDPPGTVRYRETRATLNGTAPKVIAPGKDRRNSGAGNADTPPAIATPNHWDVLLPYRWVEIDGFPGKLEARDISRRAAYLASWDDSAAEFHSSSDLLNRVWQLSRDSIKATSFAGIYVDGDRERIPYEGDAYLNQLSHYYTDNDKQMARDTFDHLMHHPTWPTEWASHMVFMAYADWMHTGDAQWLKRWYEPLKEKLLLDRTRSDGLITSTQDQIDKGDLVDWPPGERDDYEFSSINTVVNAFHLKSISLMSDIAAAVGDSNGSQHYQDIYQRTLASFQAELFSDDEGLYKDGIDSQHYSLHANLFTLAFGLVPEERKPELASWLAKQDMRCSVYAAQYFLEGLFQNGHAGSALDLMTARNDRSWRHMLEQGATITWEAWDVKYKPNLDWNHAWGAAPANLLPRYVLGVEPLVPGWRAVRIRPNPGHLTFAQGKIPTPQGPITINWRLDESFQLSLDLPPGVEGQLELPAILGSSEAMINGRKIKARREAGLWRLEELVSGTVVVEVLGK